MPSRYRDRLIKHIQHDRYTPATTEQLADDLGIPAEERETFIEAVELLQESGELVFVGQERAVGLPQIASEITGSFRAHPKGFGFILPDTLSREGDLFVPPGQTMEALSGDRVRAEVYKSGKRPEPGKSAFVARVVEILERKQSNFTGNVYREKGLWWAKTDGKVLPEPVVLRDAESKNVKEGDKVVFEILHYPEGDMFGEGVVTKVLGESGKPNVETEAVIAAHNLPGDFPDEVMAEAREITRAFDRELEPYLSGKKQFHRNERYDLRNAFICTIDPPDAKDYDDAISIERLDKITGGGSGWRLGVHIADVANFITPGTAIDTEAAERGNSCYLPRLVIPMLPEMISNGICSLSEGVPRFCKSAFIDYDDDGNVRGQSFAATVIDSAKRMTYLEAQSLIDGDPEEARKHSKTETEYTDELVKTVKTMNTLARKIWQRRHRKGMIHLDLPDVELIYDDEGHMIDAEPEDDAYTHTIIEMFMVEANEALARLFEDLDVPILRRVHPEPVPGQQENLSEFVKVAGYRIPKAPTREDLQSLLDATKGSPAAPAVHMAVLRTLTRAEYSPSLIGHFALASPGYAHFTSPIRRYPDLTVHRALTEYLRHTENGTKTPKNEGERKALGKTLRESDACPDEMTLKQVASVCNRTEERATGAERELRQFLVLQFLEREHLGDSMPGVVTGVAPNGVFVRLDKYLAEG
ncbi:MAG: ribonuclease R family protein, partial [Phycisphaerales bacterium]